MASTPYAARVARGADRHLLAVDQDLPRIGWVSAREGVDQGRLAGAVPADQRDDLARVQVDRHAVDGVDAAEGHPDVAQLDERHPFGAHRLGIAGRIVHVASSVSGAARAERVQAHRGDQHEAHDDVLRR